MTNCHPAPETVLEVRNMREFSADFYTAAFVPDAARAQLAAALENEAEEIECDITPGHNEGLVLALDGDTVATSNWQSLANRLRLRAAMVRQFPDLVKAVWPQADEETACETGECHCHRTNCILCESSVCCISLARPAMWEDLRIVVPRYLNMD